MLKKLLFLNWCLLFLSCGNESNQATDIADLNEQEQVASFAVNTGLKEDIAAYKTVVNVIRETGLAQNFVILPGNVSRVKAYIKDNERILEYNPEFMQKLQGDTNWHGISVLAHQIGHHLSNHALDNGNSNLKEELEADRYAGFVLHKMGATLAEAVAALETANLEEKLEGNASMNARLTALTQGWNNSELLSSDTVLIAAADIPKPKVEEKKERQVIKSSNSRKPDYVYQIFLALDTSFYYINESDAVFKEIKGKYENVGERKESTKPGFEWIFVKGDDSYGVDARGRLWAFSMDGNFHVVGQALKLNK